MMMFQLASPYIPVVVVVLFWALAMRPVLRLIHASGVTPGGRSRRGRPARAAPRERHGATAGPEVVP
jgi:hypothetical protein